MLRERILIISAAAVLDLIVGDPKQLWHPVRGIGTLIQFLEKQLRRTRLPERIQGTVLACLVPCLVTAISVLLLRSAYGLHPWVGRILSVIMCCQMLAARSLRDESMEVYDAAKRGDVEGSRKAVSMIVGRDTSVLDQTGIIKAAVETVAENCSDGVTAPLLFMLLFGVPGGWFYKSVNTMDSMIGYKNDRYMRFGTAAAKLDDILNYIPSRISALLMILTAFLFELCSRTGKGGVETGRCSGKNAWRIWRRDRRKHASPNSAQTEAACAGALGIQLAGDAVYFGKTVKKPTIGDPTRPVENEDIRRACHLMFGTAWILWAVGTAVLYLCR